MNITRHALGSWPHAPLALVVAQVRFLPNPEVEPASITERIKRRVGVRFPHIAPLSAISFVIGPQAAAASSTPPADNNSAGFELRDATDTQAIRMQLGSLTFITAAYEDSEQFTTQWRELMEALCEPGPVRVLRIGLRTVDFVLPSSDNVPEDYFLDGLGRSPAVLGIQSPIAFQLFDFEREKRGRLRIQYSRGYGVPALPPDLQDAVLPPTNLTTQSNAGLAAVLDMDRWQPYNDHMDADSIGVAIEQLRVDLRKSFRSMMSPLAELEWCGKIAGEEM